MDDADSVTGIPVAIINARVFDGDPLTNIGDTLSIRSVWRGGVRLVNS